MPYFLPRNNCTVLVFYLFSAESQVSAFSSPVRHRPVGPDQVSITDEVSESNLTVQIHLTCNSIDLASPCRSSVHTVKVTLTFSGQKRWNVFSHLVQTSLSSFSITVDKTEDENPSKTSRKRSWIIGFKGFENNY